MPSLNNRIAVLQIEFFSILSFHLLLMFWHKNKYLLYFTVLFLLIRVFHLYLPFIQEIYALIINAYDFFSCFVTIS